MKIWIYRMVLLVVSAVTFVPSAAFTQRLFLSYLSAEKGFFESWLLGLIYGHTSLFMILGFVSSVLMAAALLLLVLSVFSFETDSSGGLIISEDSLYFRAMSKVYGGIWKKDRDGCAIYWMTVFVFTLLSLAVLSLVFGLPFTVNYLIGLKWMDIVGALIFFAVVVAFILVLVGLMWLLDRFFINGDVGKFVVIGVYSFKNGSCPRISSKKVSS